MASSDIGIVGWGGRRIPVSPGRPLAPAHGDLNLNHREYKGSRFDQTFRGGLRGSALADQPDDRSEPAGHREPALVGWIQLELRLRRSPGSERTGSARACG